VARTSQRPRIRINAEQRMVRTFLRDIGVVSKEELRQRITQAVAAINGTPLRCTLR